MCRTGEGIICEQDALLQELDEDFSRYVFNTKTAEELLFNDRYELIECIEQDELGASFSAIDHKNNKQPVWLHLFENTQDNEWASKYRKLARKLQRVCHENLAEITHWKLLDNVGYIVNRQENGIRIGEFIKNHKMTYPEIIDFSLQLTAAFEICEANDIQCYKLNFNDIAVYEKEDGSFLYRLITVGHSSILHLTHQDREQIDWLTSAETRPPEAYEGILRGIKTTQYILSQIIYKAVIGSHPCEGLDIDSALAFHNSIKRIDFGEYQDDIPGEFRVFYRRISSPCIERRYETAKQLHHELVRISQCRPETKNLDSAQTQDEESLVISQDTDQVHEVAEEI